MDLSSFLASFYSGHLKTNTCRGQNLLSAALYQWSKGGLPLYLVESNNSHFFASIAVMPMTIYFSGKVEPLALTPVKVCLNLKDTLEYYERVTARGREVSSYTYGWASEEQVKKLFLSLSSKDKNIIKLWVDKLEYEFGSFSSDFVTKTINVLSDNKYFAMPMVYIENRWRVRLHELMFWEEVPDGLGVDELLHYWKNPYWKSDYLNYYLCWNELQDNIRNYLGPSFSKWTDEHTKLLVDERYGLISNIKVSDSNVIPPPYIPASTRTLWLRSLKNIPKIDAYNLQYLIAYTNILPIDKLGGRFDLSDYEGFSSGCVTVVPHGYVYIDEATVIHPESAKQTLIRLRTLGNMYLAISPKCYQQQSDFWAQTLDIGLVQDTCCEPIGRYDAPLNCGYTIDDKSIVSSAYMFLELPEKSNFSDSINSIFYGTLFYSNLSNNQKELGFHFMQFAARDNIIMEWLPWMCPLRATRLLCNLGFILELNKMYAAQTKINRIVASHYLSGNEGLMNTLELMDFDKDAVVWALGTIQDNSMRTEYITTLPTDFID